MKKLLGLALLSLILNGSAFGAAATVKVKEIAVHAKWGANYFISEDSGKCPASRDGFHFYKDSSEEGKKAILSTLLTAKASGSKVYINYDVVSESGGSYCRFYNVTLL
ncbi:MAG: hypothetical protein HRU19_27150 [Pseudobacteriovorax sp.]|nr:hypothetical protein [Pseudobacteriovorax sp.]